MKEKDPNFRVCLTTILSIDPHPNKEVERLEIATVYGFQVIVGKGSYKIGQKIIYMPVNSVLPGNIENLLFPPDAKIKLEKSRVKACRIQKFVSQGMLADWEEIKKLCNLPEFELETDLQEQLGVVKYYPPPKGPERTAPKEGKPRSKAHENEYFKEYKGCVNIKWEPHAFEETNQVWISEKIHGCVQSDTLITLWDGSKRKIKEIVDNFEDLLLLGYDKNNNPVPTKIKTWYNNGVSKNWLQIQFEKNKLKGANTDWHKIEVTPNHKFYLFDQKEYIEASKLTVGQKISISRKIKKLSPEQKSVLIGKMLGDGSLIGDSISFGHKLEHEEYLKFTLKSLGELAGKRQKNIISGFGTEICRARSISCEAIRNEFSKWYDENNKKSIPMDIELDPISVAFWYMDDGSLSHSDNQQDRAHFATCGFDEDSVYRLVVALKKLLNCQDIISYKSDDNKYWRIRLNLNAAHKMFDMIRPYIPYIMQYKLPKEMRDDNVAPIICEEKEEFIVEQHIIQIIFPIETDKYKKKNWSKYDLETETHNYVANNVIVHNSNFRCGYMPFVPPVVVPIELTRWQKIKKWVKKFIFGEPLVLKIIDLTTPEKFIKIQILDKELVLFRKEFLSQNTNLNVKK